MDSPTDWLASRTPPAPDELTAGFAMAEAGTESTGRAVEMHRLLVEAGLVQLSEAVARSGRDREAAHRLLAADALITYACEAAGEAADVGGALREILGRVRRGEGGA